MAEFSIAHDQEQQVKKLKRFLEGWRVALLPLKSVILWEQQWHPCAIVASISFVYLLVWILDYSALSTFAIVGLLINFIDFIVPVICNSLYGPSSWTGQQEKTFEDICKNIVESYNQILYKVKNFYSLRETRPLSYYLISISMLCILAWLASSINNIFLLYLLSIVVLLWPGVQHSGIFNTPLSLIYKTSKGIKSK